MYRFLLSIILILFLLPSVTHGQTCEMSQVNAIALPCDGDYFMVSVNIVVTNSSPGFTLAGNGVIYGTFLYNELPVTVGPFLGDDESIYSFIAWDVENPQCQQYTTLSASNCGPICNFSNAVLDSISCVNNNFALVELDFDHEGTTNPAFDVFYENGNEVGSWLYESLPVTITSFAVNGNEPIILTICDNNNLDCCETFEFNPIDCNPNNCEIFNVNIDPECTGNNFVVHLDFEIDNAASDSFTVTGNSLNYGMFAYNELPLTLGPLNGGTTLVWEFIIRDIENLNCQESAVLGLYNCPPPCDILSLEADALLCNGNDAYSLLVALDIEGEGDNGFSVFSETTYYGTFEYDNLPVTIPAYQSDCQIADLVTVCDNEIPGCCASVIYEALLCCGCIIYDLNAVAQPCNAQNEIFVLLDFNFQNVSGSGFTVFGNGEQYGNYAYEDVPVLIGPFPGNGSQFLEFVVADIENEDCFDATEIGLLSCSDICELSNPVVETGDCVGNNTYILTLDFDFENTQGDFFDLFANGVFYGFFNYNELPLTLQDFPGSGNNVDVITVCDNDDPDCCTTIEFAAPECECHIFEANIILIGCSSDSTFSVSLEFFYENLPGDFVDVFFNDSFIGFYSVNDIPLLVNIPEGDGTGILRVSANDLETCFDEVAVELLNCEGPECYIFELFAEVGACTSDSTFVLDIFFDTLNLPSDSVLIYANDNFIGQFLVDPEFIHIQNFPVLDGNLTNLNVCADGVIGCCEDYTFATPDCDSTNCEIWDLVADPGICTSDSTYVLVIEYNSENIPGDSVSVFANGDLIGTFIDPEEHILIENFPWFDGDQALLSVCSVTFPDCCDSYEYEIPNCPGPIGCGIFDLVVNFEGCQSDSTYIVVVNFGFNELPGDSVIITANDNFIGQFQINEGHIIIENFPVLPSNQTVVNVCAVGAPDCCDVYEFETPDCPGGGCNIFELVVNFEGCQTDSTYFVAVNFEYSGLPSDSVNITANGIPIGTFPVNDGNIIVENVPVLPFSITTMSVCAVGAPDCCDVYEYITPDCEGGECIISGIAVDVGEITSDSTFSAIISFDYQNVNGGFDVYAGLTYLGFFTFEQLPIVTSNFPCNSSGDYVVTICESDNLECCSFFEFDGPPCVESCDIFNLEWSCIEGDSAGTFFFILNFEFEFVGNEGFSVVGNGNNYGNFSYENLPAQIGPFEEDKTAYEFLVLDAQFKECFDFVAPGVVDCITATTQIGHDHIFQVYNNGTIPGILALKDVELSLFNSNGKMLIHQKSLSVGRLFELTTIPSGMYIGIIAYQGHTWPVKLVKNDF